MDSTNSEAKRLLKGKFPPFWVVADEQTAGRGRHAREWVSSRGNLFSTLALAPSVPIGRYAEFGFLLGLALHDAIRPLLSADESLQLKWPNDLLLNGAKLSGLLLETVGAHLILGVGVNIASAPAVDTYDTTCLASALTVAPPTPISLLDSIDQQFFSRQAEWALAGFSSILDAWRQRSFDLGTPISVSDGGTRLTGTFAGLGEAGELLLATDKDTKRRHAGDVMLLTQGEARFAARD